MDNQATPWRTKARPGATEQPPQRDPNYLNQLGGRRPMQYQDNVGPDYAPQDHRQQSYYDPRGQPQPQNQAYQQPYYEPDPYGQPQPQYPPQQPYPQQPPRPMPQQPRPQQPLPQQPQAPVAQPNIKKRVILYSLIGVVVILTITFVASLIIFFMKFG